MNRLALTLGLLATLLPACTGLQLHYPPVEALPAIPPPQPPAPPLPRVLPVPMEPMLLVVLGVSALMILGGVVCGQPLGVVVGSSGVASWASFWWEPGVM